MDTSTNRRRIPYETKTHPGPAAGAFGRKVRRTESAWVAKGNPNGTPPGLTDARGWGNNSDRPAPGSQSKGADKGNGKDKADPCAEEETKPAPQPKGQEKSQAHKKLKLAESTTSYLYDGLGLNVLKEYKGLSADKAEYYYANGQVLARKMFGLKGEILPDREPGLANGGLYYYLTDALGSVTDLVDQQGAVVRKYRYDAFGGLFTGTLGLYNSVGLTGKSYDAKAGLMDYGARWYDPQVGRFTQADTFKGFLDDAVTQHLFAYTGNNPVNRIDPTGNHFRNPQNELTWGQLYDICQTHPEYGWQPCDDWEYFHDHDPGYVDPTPPVTPPENPPGGTTPPPVVTTPPPVVTTPPPGGTTPPPPDTPPVQPPAPPPTDGEVDAASTATKQAASGDVPVTTYIVKPGDTLSAIALAFYGDASMYEKIWLDNKDQIKDPNLIKVGQEIKILGALPPEVRKLVPTPGVPAPGPAARSNGVALYTTIDDAGIATTGDTSFNTQGAVDLEPCRDTLQGCATLQAKKDTPQKQKELIDFFPFGGSNKNKGQTEADKPEHQKPEDKGPGNACSADNPNMPLSPCTTLVEIGLPNGAKVIVPGSLNPPILDGAKNDDAGPSGGQKSQGNAFSNGADDAAPATPTLRSNLADHVKFRDLSVPRKRGIGGAHNLDEFVKNSHEINIVNVVDHPSVPGIKKIEYQMAALDITGKPTGQWQSYVHTKTVYDPSVISDAQIMQWGKEAVLDASSTGATGRTWKGQASNSLEFVIHTDGNGTVTTFFPDM